MSGCPGSKSSTASNRPAKSLKASFEEGIVFKQFTGAETPEPHKQLVGDAMAGALCDMKRSCEVINVMGKEAQSAKVLSFWQRRSPSIDSVL